VYLRADIFALPRFILVCRAMKHYFFLSQASFLTHFLELAGPELRKPPKNAPLVKLQSLLDLSLNMNFSGEEVAFKYKEDVKVSIATSGLYDWLLKVVSLSGFTGFGSDDGGETDFGAGPSTEEERKKDKDKEKKRM
jgi:gamma-tubulin complex component 2